METQNHKCCSCEEVCDCEQSEEFGYECGGCTDCNAKEYDDYED